MSGFTQTTDELIYSVDAAATTSVVSASAVTITAGYPACKIYGSIFKNGGASSELNSSLKLKMGGLLTATATVPTFTFTLYWTTATPPAFATTNTLVASGAVTPSVVSNAWWFLECDIALRALGSGAASTISAHGEIRSPAAFPSPFSITIPAAGAYSPVATYETDIQAFLWPALTLGAATAGNTVTVQFMKLYGEN